MEVSGNIEDIKGCRGFTVPEVLSIFDVKFLDKKKCRDWVLKTLHPEGLRCHECFYNPESRKCKTCLKKTSLKGAQLTPEEALFLAFLLGLNVNKIEIARILKITPDTVRNWQAKFRACEGNNG